jgi:hypothetical protein
MRQLLTVATLFATSAIVACTPSAVRTGAYPIGPGLLEGRPTQTPGTYRLVGWVLSDQTGEPVGTAQIVVDGTTIVTHTDKYGRYLLGDVPVDRAIIVRAVGYQSERRTFARKARLGTWVCPSGDCKPTFTDTLNFWLHQYR